MYYLSFVPRDGYLAMLLPENIYPHHYLYAGHVLFMLRGMASWQGVRGNPYQTHVVFCFVVFPVADYWYASYLHPRTKHTNQLGTIPEPEHPGLTSTPLQHALEYIQARSTIHEPSKRSPGTQKQTSLTPHGMWIPLFSGSRVRRQTKI